MRSIFIKKTGILVVSLLFIIYTGRSQSSFLINGEINSLRSDGKVTLTLRENDQWTEHPVEVKSGKFTISGKVNEPAFAYLVLKYKAEVDKSPRVGNVLELFVDNSVIEIKAKDSLINA